MIRTSKQIQQYLAERKAILQRRKEKERIRKQKKQKENYKRKAKMKKHLLKVEKMREEKIEIIVIQDIHTNHNRYIGEFSSDDDLYLTREELQEAEARGEGKINWDKWDKIVAQAREKLNG